MERNIAADLMDEAIAELQELDAAGIAKLMWDRGIEGNRHDLCSCVLAAYFTWTGLRRVVVLVSAETPVSVSFNAETPVSVSFNAETPVASSKFWSVYGEVKLDKCHRRLPDHVADFARYFDQGMYPYLVRGGEK